MYLKEWIWFFAQMVFIAILLFVAIDSLRLEPVFDIWLDSPIAAFVE